MHLNKLTPLFLSAGLILVMDYSERTAGCSAVVKAFIAVVPFNAALPPSGFLHKFCSFSHFCSLAPPPSFLMEPHTSSINTEGFSHGPWTYTLLSLKDSEGKSSLELMSWTAGSLMISKANKQSGFWGVPRGWISVWNLFLEKQIRHISFRCSLCWEQMFRIVISKGWTVFQIQITSRLAPDR